MSAEKKSYYLGLDIGTDSVGYAAADESYVPLKFKGEPVMGVMTFEAAETKQERRKNRTARRRLDRRQQRVELVNEIFAAEIGKIDPRFFIRRRESALYRDETPDRFIQFNESGFSDIEYYAKYPTIHHLIAELMHSKEPHDVRLVYIACAWLVAHRGHFLFDVPAEETAKLLDFGTVYEDFCRYFTENAMPLPWAETVKSSDICAILTMNAGVTRKKEAFREKIFGGKKPSNTVDEERRYSCEAVCSLLSGAKVKPEELFKTGAYTEVESVTLSSAEEDFARVLSELGEDGELLLKLRALQDCALLKTTTRQCGVAQKDINSISEAKIAVYEQHKKDLADLKRFIRKYLPKQYNAIFREAGKENYSAYSYHAEKEIARKIDKRASKDVFSKYLLDLVKELTVKPEDEAFFEDMKERLGTRTFLPKQKDTDNRVVPQQLYRQELKALLDNAEAYLPMLSVKDETGLTAKEKLLSVFDFRIPYFVGPLSSHASNKWLIRKAEGRIYPWNFKDMIDFEATEDAFILKMTNSCSYLANKKVLPVKSLLYQKFTVLNEINKLRVDGVPVPVEVKQAVYTDLLQAKLRVSRKDIAQYLISRGLMKKDAEVSGVDIRLNASLSSFHQFRSMLRNGKLTEEEVEKIIERAAYSEDKTRMLAWLAENFKQLSAEDRKYIARLNLKEFGRLSAALLTGLEGADTVTGEVMTIMQALWETNDNLMQLLSEKYTFRDRIKAHNEAYYREYPADISERLDKMYISNAVKRPILRTLEICKDVVKAAGCAPKRIFVEMARDVSGDKPGKRTESRKEQLLALYKKIKTEEVRALEREIAAMGDTAENRLQSKKLFLYYLQLGRDAYTGKPIDFMKLMDEKARIYDIDHIYPRSFVKDDSILNNLVLVDSNLNGEKTNKYPLDPTIRASMTGFWTMLRSNDLMSEEKYRRLTRSTPFTDEERWGFINRQLVETRQSTKAVAELLQERYPETEIVYVKAGLVSEFRQTYDLLKSRAANDLHHAKDAYLNIVVGNVYNRRFDPSWFRTDKEYSIKVSTLFKHPVRVAKGTVWQGEADIEKVKRNMDKNAIHLTRYALCSHGKLFDVQPEKAAEKLTPLKNNKKEKLDPARYGGYKSATASFFSLVRYTTSKKCDILFMAVDLMVADRYLQDKSFAEAYAKKTIKDLINKPVLSVEVLLGGRPLKVNTVLEVDGLRLLLRYKNDKGKRIGLSLYMPLLLGREWETYIKKLESINNKMKLNKNFRISKEFNDIDPQKNIALYDILTEKMKGPYYRCPGNQADVMENGRKTFLKLNAEEQVRLLLEVIAWFSSATGGHNLKSIGGANSSGEKRLSSYLSGWKKYYTVVRIVDVSPSGLFEHRSGNLLELL